MNRFGQVGAQLSSPLQIDVHYDRLSLLVLVKNGLLGRAIGIRAKNTGMFGKSPRRYVILKLLLAEKEVMYAVLFTWSGGAGCCRNAGAEVWGLGQECFEQGAFTRTTRSRKDNGQWWS